MMGHVESGATCLVALSLALHLVSATTTSSSLDVGAVRVVRVRRDGAGDFRTVTDAVNSIPSGNKRRVVVWIGRGVYREKITVDRSKPFVTFYGERNGNDNDNDSRDIMPIITYDATALRYGTVDSATVAVDADYFVAVNVAFVVRYLLPFSFLFIILFVSSRPIFVYGIQKVWCNVNSSLSSAVSTRIRKLMIVAIYICFIVPFFFLQSYLKC